MNTAQYLTIDKNSRITLHFELSSMQNKAFIIDTNFDSEPASFVYSDGSLLPGFEEKLLGLRAGDTADFIVSAEKAFGEVREDNQHWFSTAKFKDLELSVGLMINFSGNEQSAVTGVVSEIKESQVLVDFNHPLAGQDIFFKVKIIDVQVSDNIFVQQVGTNS